MDYAVIMAGGTGTRLWPLSRRKRPKQVLRLIDGQTLLRLCFNRLSAIFDAANVLVLTNTDYVEQVRENLPELPEANIIGEPVVRDTAGAIGLAATILTGQDPQATMAVVTADQLIEPPEKLQQAVRDALAFVNTNPSDLVTFGVRPAYPSTQLGYLKCGPPQRYGDIKSEFRIVKEFREKPDEQTAEEYLAGAGYLWNSGMFVWKAKTILANIERFLPESTEPLNKIKLAWGKPNQHRTLEEWFAKMPKISIDYAVMEKADKVYAITLDCHWVDMGSFTALAEVIEPDANNNVVAAKLSKLLDCKNNIIVTEDRRHLIAAVGLENIVVAHSPDVTLVCRADQAPKIKELLELIRKDMGEKFL